MNKQIINFSSSASALQGNEIQITFDLVRDDTVYHGHAVRYRYRYWYTPLYCGTTSADYAYYNDDAWTVNSKWEEIEFPTIVANGAIYFIIPRFSYDVLLKLEVQVYEDGTNSYYASTPGSYTNSFIGFYNGDPSFKMSRATRLQDNSIEVNAEITESGLFKPLNYHINMVETEGWKYYCVEMMKSFFEETQNNYLTISCNASQSSTMKNSATTIVQTFPLNQIYTWHPQSLTYVLPLTDDWTIFGPDSNTYLRLAFDYAIGEQPGFKFSTDQTDGTLLTNTVLLPAEIASFQIKRRAIKTQMLEEDAIIGAYSTGSGMFNHGSDVGVQPKQNSVAFVKEWESSFGWWGISETHKESDWYLIGVVNGSSNSYEDKGEMTVQMIDAVSMSFYNADYFDCQINIDNIIAGFYTPISATLKVIQSKDNPSYYYGESGDIRIEIHETLVDGPLIRNIAIYIRGESKELLASQRAYSKISINTYALASPKINPGLGHSIALYDTHVKDGAIEPSNEPSIGFMNHEHAELASLKYSGGQLVSSVPITWNGIQPGGGGSDLPLNTIVLHTSNAITGELGAKTQIKITGNLVIETTQH